jgi:hypothetical protein
MNARSFRLLAVFLALTLCVGPAMIVTGCSTPPSERVVAVQTLKGLGLARESAMRVAGIRYAEGKITDAQRDEIIAKHDQFQSAYLLAVAGVQADLTLASPQLVAMLADLQTLINSYK